MATNGFRQHEKFGDAMIVAHRTHEDPRHREHRPILALMRNWLVVPYSLWPADFAGMSHYICGELNAGRALDEKLLFLLRLLRRLPPKAAQRIVRKFEHNVNIGEYRPFFRSNAKYDAYERIILASQTLRATWETLKALYAGEPALSSKKIMRRRMVQERNFKTADWSFRWNDEKDKFQRTLDALCYGSTLYGIEDEKMLLLKPTVNVTPYGTLIMIPPYMSPDFVRDLFTKEITAMNKALGAAQVSEKRHEARLAREKEARDACLANEDAIKRGLKGEKRRQHIITKARLLKSTDDRKIRHLIKEGAAVLKKGLQEPAMPASTINEPPPARETASRDRLAQAKAAIGKLDERERKALLEWLR